ncbi:MAG: hypothetical protein ABI920_04790 [Casimicrobiaceae bacterium]
MPRQNFIPGGSMHHHLHHHLVLALLAAATAAGAFALLANAQTHQHDTMAPAIPRTDTRQMVTFPEALRIHTIANMRDHLLALQEIDEALAKGGFDKASVIAEQRLGMSSLGFHGAHDIAPYMPQGMQDIGTQMHRAASRFAVESQNASVSNDMRPALAALGTVMQQCVACHATYRLH